MFFYPRMFVEKLTCKNEVPLDFAGFGDNKVAVVCAVGTIQSKHSEIVKQGLQFFPDEEVTVGFFASFYLLFVDFQCVCFTHWIMIFCLFIILCKSTYFFF